MAPNPAAALAPRKAKLLLWLVLGIYCLMVVVLVVFAVRGYAIPAVVLMGVVIPQTYLVVKKWRLQRYGQEIQRRMQNAGENPTDDPGLKGN